MKQSKLKCSTGTVATLYPNFLAEFWSHAAQFVETLTDPLHNLSVGRSFAGGQEAILAGQLLFVGLLDLFECRKSLHWNKLFIWLGRQFTFGREPPTHRRSTTTVFWPDCAKCQARYFPPSPLPMITFL
jgi:hypothetical protein